MQTRRGAVFQARGNRLTSIVLAEQAWSVLNSGKLFPNTFATCFVSDNTFFRDSSEFLAEDLGFTSNKFRLTNTHYYAAVIADEATFTGNRGDNYEGQVLVFKDHYAAAANRRMNFTEFS